MTGRRSYPKGAAKREYYQKHKALLSQPRKKK